MEAVERQSIARELEAIVGAKNVRADDVIRWTYAIEDFGGTFFHPLSAKYGPPDMVVKPHSTEEVSRIVKLANARKVPIIARGGGHDMTGAATPLKGVGGIILDMTAMNRVLAFERGLDAVKCEAGIRWGELHHECAKKGVTVGCTGPHGLLGGALGGGISGNCFSGCSPKYGWLNENVLTLQVVLPNGDIIETGSLANTSEKDWFFRYCNGPDLLGIFLGGGGAFGVITEFSVKTYPIPQHSDTLIYTFAETERYLQFIHNIAWHGYVTELWAMAYYSLHDGLKNLIGPLMGERDFVALTTQAYDRDIFKAQKKAIDRMAREQGGTLYPVEGLMRALGASVIDTTEFVGGALYGKVMGPNDACTCSVTPVLRWKDVVDGGLELLEKNQDALSGGIDMIGAEHFYIFPLLLGGGQCCQSVVSTPCNYHCGEAFASKPPQEALDPDARKNVERAQELYNDMWEFYLENHVVPYRIGKENAPLINRLKPEYREFMKAIKKALDPNNIMNPGVLGLGLEE